MSSSAGPGAAYVLAKGLPEASAHLLARRAAALAAWRAPRLSGSSARRIKPYWGPGFFGVRWADARVWYQEAGTRPYTMSKLAGKTVPMWVPDPSGELRRGDSKAKTKVAADGRTLVLIFRRAAQVGQRKNARRRVGSRMVTVSVPASYPGAPGRIATRGGGGRISSEHPVSGHVGVRWRHPGLSPKGFINQAVLEVAGKAGLGTPQVLVKMGG